MPLIAMMKSYEHIFANRGSQYDQAMRQFPNARDEEFAQLLSKADLKGMETVVDVPAGGGYLRAYLPDTCRWLGHEPCSAFHGPGANEQAIASLLPLPWADEEIDVALSLAGVHHIDDKRPFFAELNRVVRLGGRFVLSDVAAASAVAHFLDDYVGRFNSTGHEGRYLDRTTEEELRSAGWSVQDSVVSDFSWNFQNLDDMEQFCNGLFGLSGVPVKQTQRAIDEILSVVERPDGRVGMKWSLRTIVAEKNRQ